MITFLVGLLILAVGGVGYGALCQRVFRPDDRTTPAVRMADGVDYIPMKSRKNSLIQLLNIAGTGPVLGPIQGILFGPIAFITIPIGCIIGGAFHDYMTGMMSMREDGKQMPAMITVYMMKHRQPWPMAILPGMFYMFVISSFILNGDIGFRLNWTVSYIIAAVLTAAYGVVVYLAARNAAKRELI